MLSVDNEASTKRLANICGRRTLGNPFFLIPNATKSSYMKCQTLLLSNVYILAGTKPLQVCLKPLANLHTLGMRSGNIEYAMWGLVGYNIFLPYQMGEPLSSINTNCTKIISQMEDLKQNDPTLNSRNWWQLILNLMGESDDRFFFKRQGFQCRRTHFADSSTCFFPWIHTVRNCTCSMESTSSRPTRVLQGMTSLERASLITCCA
jgi:hypothetical protein